jgi:putative acetyltransferase
VKIRILEESDIPAVVELWYETSVLAHGFIPSSYWEKNQNAMATIHLPNSETYLAVERDEITGFLSMADNYLAAVFVRKKSQGSGIGKKLLTHVKKKRLTIDLKVYKKNVDSVGFYKNQGFKIVSESKEESTGEIEIAMKWNR